MDAEELNQRPHLGPADALEVQDFAEVGVAAVVDVDEVGLYERFGRGRADLEGFEEGVEAGEGGGDAFLEGGVRGEEGGEGGC